MENGQYVFVDCNYKKPRTYKYIVICMVLLIVVSSVMVIVFLKHDKKVSNPILISGCGHKIPTIDNHTFCVGYDNNGVYYFNDKLQIRIK